MRRWRPLLVAVTFVIVSSGLTGCRVVNDRTTTVTGPEPAPTDTAPVEETADDPAGTTTSTVAPADGGSVSQLSEEEIEDLERRLDEIDRLLSDAERAFTED